MSNRGLIRKKGSKEIALTLDLISSIDLAIKLLKIFISQIKQLYFIQLIFVWVVSRPFQLYQLLLQTHHLLALLKDHVLKFAYPHSHTLRCCLQLSRERLISLAVLVSYLLFRICWASKLHMLLHVSQLID